MAKASLSERVLQGDVRAASRLMRNIDDGEPAATEALREEVAGRIAERQADPYALAEELASQLAE